jgi:HEAT repeat protein
MRALGQIRGSARVGEVLTAALEDADAWVRYYACQAIGRLGFDAAADAVIGRLADAAGQVRVAAVEALACLDSPRARSALDAAVADAEADIRRAALVGLGVARRAESLPVLLAAAVAPDPATRLVALSAVVRFPSPAVLDVLKTAVGDPDESVRTAALGFLAATPGAAATAVLVGLLSGATSIEPIVSALSSYVEGRIAGLLAALETADDETASALTSALARLHRPDALEALLSVMKMSNYRARRAAATTMAALATREAQAMLKTAAQEDPDPGVRQISSLLLAR